LRHQGAEVVYGGCVYPLNPFYFGLYGGSELPGILDSDAASRRLYEQSNYQVADRVIVLQKDLHGFRVPMDRKHLQARRTTRTEITADPPPSTWWEACTTGPFPRQRHTLVRRTDNQTLAAATWRGMEPLSIGWGVNAVGLIHIEVDEEFRRQGYGSYLLNEVFSHLHSTGATVVETQTMERNAGALAFYKSLGFERIDSGVIYRKTGGNGKVT
jgi:ribosomal protein S18 acetylase RimI-like enzyme